MSTNRLTSILFGVLALSICLPANIMAVQHNREETMIAKELKTLSSAVDNLAQQMARLAGNEQQDTTLRKLDIAIAYLNFRSRRIELFEQDLQAARTNRNRLDDVLEQFQREEESLSNAFDANQRDAMQRAREEMSFRRQVVKDRISRMNEEIILLENRIMDMQSQIDSVESFVQKNLEF
jgi:predicted  nucleic acid-binding Zn-ribbon protein